MTLMVDKYFSKTRNCVDSGRPATYGVFLRHNSICAVGMAIKFINEHCPNATIVQHYPEGAIVPAEKAIFSYRGDLEKLVELETEMLMRVGLPCICAHNAYYMSMAYPTVPFLDMHARHAASPDMVMAAAYGASVGSKAAQAKGAKGFIGSSLDQTAAFYGAPHGLGTMPHVLIGYAGSTLDAVKLFIERNPDRHIVALVDYHGRELTDSLEVAAYIDSIRNLKEPYSLGIRLDTHGGRFAEGLDYGKSVEIVERWLKIEGEWSIVRAIMGDEAYDICDDATRDRVRAILFGTGVSVANIIQLRETLDRHRHKIVKIVVSSGFDVRKCRVMGRARAPIDMIGTGSFLPKDLSSTFATADVYEYDGQFRVKVGRESVFSGLGDA